MRFMIFSKAADDEVISAIIKNGDVSDVMSRIIEYAELESPHPNILRGYLASVLADDENVLSVVLGSGGSVSESLKKAAISDLTQLLSIADNCNIDYSTTGGISRFSKPYTESICAMCSASSAEEFFDALCTHYKTLGTGIFSKYIAFMQSKDGIFGIDSPDSASFDKLVGLEHIKSVLIENTRALLSGERANNVLLFGDRGTGKSSCVKALLNMFAPEGLRVIELPKHCIDKISELFRLLSKKPQKFILYLDDLSFEKHEPEYRSLKVAMDGQLGSMPQNVIICATSNRRHLIKENWKDREGGDVHANDNMQEMLSLSERFGISLVFAAPNQREYLDIVAKLLAAKGVEITPDIERQAVVWQMNYGGRTPRCAAQFVAAYKQD